MGNELQEIDLLNQVNDEAAASASRALSKLIDKPVDVGISKADVKRVEELSPLIGQEEVVAGIYLPVTGDIKGAALLIFPKETAFTLSDLLVKREPGTTRKLVELDKSALKEVGNIISGSYLTILSNVLQIKIVEHIPNFSFDMFGAIVSQIITDFAQKTENALVIEIEFIFKPETLKGYFLLLFEVEQLKAMLGSVGGGGIKDLLP
ncbi:MAG: chemotaxis protein CheC [Phycisphaerae bacterium]